jgi:hypothetical protein
LEIIVIRILVTAYTDFNACSFLLKLYVLSQINRYAAGWQLTGSSEDAAGWQIVDPDDLIPVVDISAPVDAYLTGIPATDYTTASASLH